MEAAQREAVKAGIQALYREAEAAREEATRMRDQAAALAQRWQATAPAGNPGRAPSSAPVPAPVRVDHLGASTYLEKGWSRLALGDAEAAEAALRHALTLAPGHAEGEVLLAWALVLQGRQGEARELLEGVLARIPEQALALATLGLLYLRAGDLDAAEPHLRAALAVGSDRKAALYAWFHLGVVARRRGDLPGVEVAMREALALGPNLLQAWYEQGRAQWEAGRALEAVASWRAGAAASKFSPWGQRCSEVLAQVEAGEPPRFSGA